MSPEALSDIGHFQLIRVLGSGGMGTVYEAFDREQSVRVALKRLHHTSPTGLLRLKAEFRSLRDLQHPNLVRLGELVESQGEWFFTMELVRGVDFLEYVGSLAALTPSEKDLLLDATVPVLMTPSDTPDVELIPSLPATREPARFDAERLRASLAQLAQGLGALHAAGKVHRDIKPNNLLVTPEGRLVLLDFGLVAESGSSALVAGSKTTVEGTPAYMAPELLNAGGAGPAADWYSVGVLLYHALTHRLPWSGSARALLGRHRPITLWPRDLVRDVPEDLDQLCRALLAVNPAERPDGAAVLDRLTRDASRARLAPMQPSLLVGRDAELTVLRASFAQTRALQGSTVLVEGESGVGKSALCRFFLDELRPAEPQLLLLFGRSHEREAVPYKALDGVVDDLTRALALLPAAERTLLLPADSSALAQLFPVLAQLTSAETPAAASPLRSRAEGFAVLRELLVRLGRSRPTVLFLDDLQWADADSRALLTVLLAEPMPPLLVLATSRPSERALWSRERESEVLGQHVQTLTLKPLSAQSAAQLVSTLLAQQPGMTAELARGIAAEAHGLPLFIQELAMQALAGGSAHPGGLALDEVLWQRAEKLAPTPRHLLAFIGVADAPTSHEALRAAAKLQPEAYVDAIRALEAERLIRTSGTRQRDVVEPFHDRIRETVQAHQAASELPAIHRALAEALSSRSQADLAQLARHWRGAGELPLAAQYAERAADVADQALAFDRAARLYQEALELDSRAPERVEQRKLKLAHTLARAGRAAEAARLYLEMAARAAPARQLELRQRAAENFLHSGHFQEGRSLLFSLGQDVGLSFPSSRIGMIGSLMATRARLFARGLELEEGPPRQTSETLRQRTDLAWSVVTGFGLSDTLLGAVAGAQYLALALQTGDPYRVARGLVAEYSFRAGVGGTESTSTRALLSRARDFAARTGNEELAGLAAALESAVRYARGDPFAQTLALGLEAERIFQQLPGHSGELASARHFANLGLFGLGRWAELRARKERQLAEARERDDVFALSNLLMSDVAVLELAYRPEAELRAELEGVFRRWPRDLFAVAHLHELITRVQLDLARGRGVDAFQYLKARWAALQRSFLPRLPGVGARMLELRARTHLGVLAGRSGARGPSLHAHLAAVRRDARRLRESPVVFGRGGADVLEGTALLWAGDTEQAARLFGQAAVEYGAQGMTLHAAAAGWKLGMLQGGSEGAKRVARARASFQGQGILREESALALLLA